MTPFWLCFSTFFLECQNNHQLFPIAQVLTINFNQSAIYSLFSDLGKPSYHHLMGRSKCRRVDQNPELSTTTANNTSTEELETANLCSGLSPGMYPYNCLFKF